MLAIIGNILSWFTLVVVAVVMLLLFSLSSFVKYIIEPCYHKSTFTLMPDNFLSISHEQYVAVHFTLNKTYSAREYMASWSVEEKKNKLTFFLLKHEICVCKKKRKYWEKWCIYMKTRWLDHIYWYLWAHIWACILTKVNILPFMDDKLGDSVTFSLGDIPKFVLKQSTREFGLFFSCFFFFLFSPELSFFSAKPRKSFEKYHHLEHKSQID